MALKVPLTIINFKAYKTSTGRNAVRLAKLCQQVAKKLKANIAVAVQPADIALVSKAVKIPVLAQHVDAIEYGAHTGSVLPENVKENGATGTLLNHSEKRIDLQTLASIIARCKKLKLATVVCASTPALAIQIAGLKPDFIAIEPPELIGGRIAVSQARPEVITETTSNIRNVPVLCGAGVHSYDDVKKAVRLGVKGILVASGVTNAKEPAKVLRELVLGLKK